MEDLKKLTDQIEYLFLKLIIDGLRNNSITVDQAKQYASQFLPIEPFASTDDAIQKVHAFCLSAPQFNKLKDFVDSLHAEKHIDDKISNMKELIAQNKIGEAIDVASQ